MECVFCDIVSGKAPCFKVWEDEKHLAFLSIYPNTEGVTVVATKRHLPSYCFELDDSALSDLVLACKKVGLVLDSKLEGVGRTALVMEGFGVNHCHAKLYPLHQTKVKEWNAINSSVDKYFEEYEGYISSHNGKRESDEKLSKTAKKIRE